MASIKILDLFPDIYSEDLKQTIEERKKLSEEIKKSSNDLIRVETVLVDKGSASIENALDEAVNAPYILEKVKWAENEGYDAVVIDCFGDPALDAARELVDIPVVGANHSACFLASQLGGKFSIISILPETTSLIENLIAKYGLATHLASIREVNIPVLDLEKNPEQNSKKIAEVIKRCINEDRASSVIFGCTGMAIFIEEVRKSLVQDGLNVPIIEPLRAALYNAVYWTLMGVSQSRLTYLPVKKKKRLLDFEIEGITDEKF